MASNQNLPKSLADRLFDEGYVFDFFQAVRWLQRLQPDRVLLGRDGPPDREILRLEAQVTLDFPASTIHRIEKMPTPDRPPLVTVAFMGLQGPSGVLPRHYTELLVREHKNPDIQALKDWFDLFNHRFISLFYRAWEKYRFFIPFERGEHSQRDLDPFSRCLFSLVGLGFRSHRQRFQVSLPAPKKNPPVPDTVLARLDDVGLLRFGGILAHRPRSAASLEVLLQAYLAMQVKVLQFQGQWLKLEADSQTSLGAQNNSMGLSTLVGDRIWDVGSKIRVRLGPMRYADFLEFLPDRSPTPQRKRLFLLAQLVRFYVGPELDVEFQLVLAKDEVPATAMGKGPGPLGSRLGWKSWSRRKPMPNDADDPVFQAEEKYRM